MKTVIALLLGALFFATQGCSNSEIVDTKNIKQERLSTDIVGCWISGQEKDKENCTLHFNKDGTVRSKSIGVAHYKVYKSLDGKFIVGIKALLGPDRIINISFVDDKIVLLDVRGALGITYEKIQPSTAPDASHR